jgi:hypothetical protein
MPGPKHNIRLSTLALKSVPLRDYEFCTTELSAVEATLLGCDWNSYEGGMLLYKLVHHASVELLQMALELRPDALASALHSDFTRALVAVAFSRHQTPESHARVLDWMLENVADSALRFMADTFVETKKQLRTLDRLAYENGFGASLNRLVERDLVSVDLLTCVQYGDLAMVERELAQSDGMFVEPARRRQFLAAADGISESFKDFTRIAELFNEPAITIKALVQPNARWLEKYLERVGTSCISSEQLDDILEWSAEWKTKCACGIVVKHFLNTLLRDSWLIPLELRALGAEGLQENWDEHFDIIWIRCRTHMILEPGALVGESRRYFPTRLQTPIMSLDEESDLPRLIEDLTVEE